MRTRSGSSGSNGSLRRVSVLYRTSGIGGGSRQGLAGVDQISALPPASMNDPGNEPGNEPGNKPPDGAAARPGRGGALTLLGSRRFGPLFATQFLSAFNDNALKNALVLMIAYRADNAGALAAGLLIPLAGGLFILPFFLCSASAGELADANDKSRLARIIKLIEIAVMLAAAAGVIAG